MKWRYSLRWKRPGPCPGEPELASEVVEAGKPAPESVMSLWVMGYSFTSPEVVSALVRAKRRGVDVRIVLDEKGNRSKASQAAMNIVVNAGIPLRTNGRYAIMHDKVIIVDNHAVEAGSFNYTRSAASRNSENVLVINEVPEVAQTYLQHWQSRWDGGTEWHSSY